MAVFSNSFLCLAEISNRNFELHYHFICFWYSVFFFVGIHIGIFVLVFEQHFYFSILQPLSTNFTHLPPVPFFS